MPAAGRDPVVLSKSQRRKQRKWDRQRRKAAKGRRYLNVPRKFVDHPRYGDKPIISGETWTEADLMRAHWRYAHRGWDPKILFPETAIRADCSRQNFCCYARWLYVDIARRCRKCRRWFIFFALEQKYWYEVLGFHIDADCLDCQECRHGGQEQERLKARYTELLAIKDKSREEWLELSGLGDRLHESGYIKNLHTLQKSRMPKRMRTT